MVLGQVVPVIGNREIHVWTARVSGLDDHFLAYYQLCSYDETRRAEGLSFQRDRRSFVMGRGMLRLLLAL